MIYGPTIRIPYSNILNANLAVLSIDFIADSVIKDISVDCSFGNEDTTLLWQSRPFRYYNNENKLSKFVYTIEIPDNLKTTDLLSFYISNSKLEHIKLDNFEIKYFKK